MAKRCFVASVIFLLTALNSYVEATWAGRKVHIVYMGDKLENESHSTPLHLSILQQITSLESYDAEELLVYSYKRSFNAFAAYLTYEEANKLSEVEGVVSVFDSQVAKPQTTRSWDFIGLTQKAKRMKSVESDIIIGFLDTGIWPESESFSDEGIGPPPSKWKGICQSNSKNFTCNNKIIGARYYFNPKDRLSLVEELSPRDFMGHGTHTSSTAAGASVSGASLYGIAEGVARGGVPSARVAMYKVCWNTGCTDHDMLAAYDDAIADGVDIISVSLGYSNMYQPNYFKHPLAIGSFHAMKKGILTCASASNNGPLLSTLSNYAPWMLVVAASTIDRTIVNKIVLGNGQGLMGKAVNTFRSSVKPLLLITSQRAAKNKTVSWYSSLCDPGNLRPPLVKGKIVLCEANNNGTGPLAAGAAGFISLAAFSDNVAFPTPLPGSKLMRYHYYDSILKYINSNSHATARILKSKGLYDPKAPMVPFFSSRGPSIYTPDILKPDIVAPGVEILAAYSPKAPLTRDDKRSVRYNILSGTSMACPHVSGAAAYVKSFHPNWSPAAIKSALMTTAIPLNSTSIPEGEFAYGSGLVNPVRALQPGLVYDAHQGDFITLLCNQGYGNKLRLITGENATCPKQRSKVSTVWGLNYPSIALLYALKDEPLVANFHRTVTNVGSANSTFRVTVTNPSPNVKITVMPNVLSFNSHYEKKSFDVKIHVLSSFKGVNSASMVWSDGIHHVRSPILVF